MRRGRRQEREKEPDQEASGERREPMATGEAAA